MSQELLLPSSVPKVSRNVTRFFWPNFGWVNCIPIFCANCGDGGPFIPEATMDFAFYLCDDCYKTWGAIAGTFAVPDEVFWARIRDAQIEKYGRILDPNELAEAIKESDNPLAKLARDRYQLPEYAESKRR